MTDLDVITCEWFAHCTNSTHHYINHPVLGPTPCCTRCATRLEMTGRLEVIAYATSQ